MPAFATSAAAEPATPLHRRGEPQWRLFCGALTCLLLPVFFGCDSGPGEDRTVPTVEVGTGGAAAFERVRDGDTLLLGRGCQGLQHVWIAVRVTDLDAGSARVRLSLRDADSGDLLAPSLDARLRFDRVGDAYELRGIQLVVPDPDEVLDRDLELVVRVTSVTSGASVEAVRAMRIAWGDEVCAT